MSVPSRHRGHIEDGTAGQRPDSPAVPAPAHSASSITLVAVGDVMLARGVGSVLQKGKHRRPFAALEQELKSGDIVFCNLESVIGSTGTLMFPEKPYNFLASTETVRHLKAGHFNAASLANNHAMDFGGGPIEETRALLRKNGIAVFGAGKNLARARAPAILKRNGIAVGFLGYSLGHSTAIYARAGGPGVSALIVPRIKDNVRALKKRTDIVVVSLHWGFEYREAPAAWQRDAARQIIDAGADLILGHHPHVIQGLEVYKGKVIAYSLGNFLFDQKSEETRPGLLLKCRLEKGGVRRVEVVPVVRGARFFPEIPAAEEKSRLLERIKSLSAALNETLKKDILEFD